MNNQKTNAHLEKIKKIVNYFHRGIWRIPTAELPITHEKFISFLRTIHLTIRGFIEDNCILWASALTFYTLLSIVPVVALIFSIAKGFGFEKKLEVILLDKFPGQEEILHYTIQFAQSYLANTKGGIIFGIGIIILFYTVIKVLGNIEVSFNAIWKIKKARNIWRKFSDYLSIMLFCPVLFVIHSSATVFITTQVTIITEKVAVLGMMSGIIFASLKILPLALIWILFSILYIILPNTRVNPIGGLLGGVVAGTIYQFWQFIYISSQVWVMKFNAIYGSFAILPLFIIWLQISWFIVLSGAELSFAYQNVEDYEFEPDCRKASIETKLIVMFAVLHLIVKNFQKGLPALSLNQLSTELETPKYILKEVIDRLVDIDMLTEVGPDDKQLVYQPAKDPHNLKINDVLNIFIHKGVNNIPLKNSSAVQALKKTFNSFQTDLNQSKGNLTIKEI